ncbi:probable tubulin polyglutamylase TTLL2 [Puntigrus tetrazona]|uniref:probable tubulin polyglutamylase TTLL2 n=1 Tax=Puntigrus tetrazona TaxID=1606681 RepID=UPI001C8AF962|nr:probable tubulin polyglutamylase TTLL2 [Puntigrus tetrazona]
MAERERGLAPLVFRLHGRAPQVVREVLLERGWEEYDEEEREEGDWNLYWRASGFRKSDYENILPWQRLNHHPKLSQITRKDCLARHLRRMKMAFGATLYGFSPAAFILPNEYAKFLGVYTGKRVNDRGKSRYWICKPVDLSRGRGIFLFEDIKDLVYDSSVIVQRYISNPLLISGYKFDLRIYVCVKSFSPLVIYMHQEGLVRFATEKYTLASLESLYSHLTNTSINKFGMCYATDKERVGRGCKWTMSRFRSFLHKQDINELLLWHGISNIVTLTLLAAVPCAPSSPNCLELLGFDILIDASYKPWLLEVNYSPALSLDCPADVSVKKGLVSDIIDLMNYGMIDGYRQKGYCRKRSGRRYLRPKISQGFLLPKTLRAAPLSRSESISSSSSSQDTSVNVGGCNNGGCATWPFHPEKAPRKFEEINDDVESDGLKRATLNSARQSQRNAPSAVCKLPSLHVRKLKSPAVPRSSATQDRGFPACRVGDFILTFPFNEATWKASQDQANVKAIVNEVHKLANRLASSLNEKRRTKMEIGQSVGVGDKFEPLLWGPKDPPLLSKCCSLSSEVK